jgi:hypothetical protein
MDISEYPVLLNGQQAQCGLFQRVNHLQLCVRMQRYVQSLYEGKKYGNSGYALTNLQ